MEKIYAVWLANRTTRNCILVKAFHESEMALAEKKKQEAILRKNAQALQYNVYCDCIEVY